MDTYSGRTDDEGEWIPDCSCGDGCQCLCRECSCPADDEEDW
jgi:hypothetical protein